MSRSLEFVAAIALAAAGVQAHAESFPGIGRAATPREVAAWDIDVRPDFKGLPAGSGSVEKGMEVWEGKCASCHGVFGESNSVFSPLIGGTTKEDIKTGRVARLTDPGFPGRTTIMKVPTVSTLWDYINRAMPWNAPKSLSTEEVYAVTAYLLNLADVVPGDFVLSDKNIAEVQKKMPNRNGMTTEHAMWPGKEFKGAAQPDVRAARCMKDCPVEAKVASMLPDHAMDAHGNLADQNRLVGPQRGLVTIEPSPVSTAPVPKKPAGLPADVAALVQKNNCFACHAPDAKLVGPSWKDISAKHAGKADYLAGKIRSGGVGVWGQIPMPPQTIADSDAKAIAGWLAGSAK